MDGTAYGMEKLARWAATLLRSRRKGIAEKTTGAMIQVGTNCVSVGGMGLQSCVQVNAVSTTTKIAIPQRPSFVVDSNSSKRQVLLAP
jgi:hypothetical protein